TSWPFDDEVVGNPTPCTTSLCRSSVTGGPALRLLLANTDGGIGYLALPDARVGFDFDGVVSDLTYWLRVQAVGTSTFFDATQNTNGWKSPLASGGPGIKGSNCLTTTYNNIPTGADPTLAAWPAVDGTGSTTGYPICTLTYDLAYDDDAAAYGNSAA